MTLKSKILALVGGLLIAFALGRYSAPGGQSTASTSTTTQTQTTDTTKNRDTHKHTQVTHTKDADGKETTVTVVDEDTTVVTDKKQDKVTDEKKTEVVQARKTLNVSALAGVDVRDLTTPVYGVSVTKEIAGPITIGAFGLTNGVVGISLGISF